MSVLSTTAPVYGDPIDVTYLKWLQELRSQFGQTDVDTEVNTNDPEGVILNKILTVYQRS